MSNAFFELKAWLRHVWQAGGPHQVHSPHVFRLLTQVLVQPHREVFQDLNLVRDQLRRNRNHLEVLELGAGSRMKNAPASRKISDIARYSLQPRKSAEALFRIINDIKPKNGLELGTSLGLTTAYMGKANPDCQWTTMEGSPEIAGFAGKLLAEQNLPGVEVRTGPFDELIPPFCANTEKLDFALFDGNHRYEPTLRYFNWLSKLAHEPTVFVLDDIHWSEEMEKAWDEICKRPEVSLSIDFFHFGVIYFRSGIEKQHFILRLP